MIDLQTKEIMNSPPIPSQQSQGHDIRLCSMHVKGDQLRFRTHPIRLLGPEGAPAQGCTAGTSAELCVSINAYDIDA
jgi:hypothetical protein